MEFEPKDQEIVNLLAKFKNINKEYPSWLLESRREIFSRQIANVRLGIGAGTGPKKIIRRGKSSAGISPTMGAVLEAALIIAILMEASAAAYIYRDNIMRSIHSSISPSGVEEIVLPPTFASPLPDIYTTETPIGSVTPTITPMGTLLTPGLINPKDNNQVTSTPDPNGNNGNHFGQTPKPERTKKPDKVPNSTEVPNDKIPKPTKIP